MTTCRAMVNSFLFFILAASHLSFPSRSLSFHTFAHSSGMSVRNWRGAVSRSGVRADPDAAIGSPGMFDAMWGDGTITVGRVGENVVTRTVWGGLARCFLLVQPCPRLPQ